MASNIELGGSVDDYGFGVSVDDDGDFGVSFGRDTGAPSAPTEEAPATPAETLLEQVRPYALPLGVALLLLLGAAALRGGTR